MAFTNQDHLIIEFSDAVSFGSFAHPVSAVQNIGGNTWKINFSANAMFTEGRMDFTANLLFPGPASASILNAYSCPQDSAGPVVPVTTAAYTSSSASTVAITTNVVTTTVAQTTPVTTVAQTTPVTTAAVVTTNSAPVLAPTCTNILPSVSILNSWTCRTCFRIRAYYFFNQ